VSSGVSLIVYAGGGWCCRDSGVGDSRGDRGGGDRDLNLPKRSGIEIWGSRMMLVVCNRSTKEGKYDAFPWL
jgi:hypothetical protein